MVGLVQWCNWFSVIDWVSGSVGSTGAIELISSVVHWIEWFSLTNWIDKMVQWCIWISWFSWIDWYNEIDWFCN